MALRQLYPSGNVNDITFIEYDSNNYPIYICKTQAGLPTSSEGWRIEKLTWNGPNLTNSQFPNASPAYVFVADNRTTYTYS